MKDNEKKGFVVYATLEQQLAFLTDVQVGQLFRAMFVHFRGEEPMIDDLMVKMAFAGVRAIMDIDREKWERTKAARQAAGRKGGETKALNAKKGQEDHPTEYRPGNCEKQEPLQFSQEERRKQYEEKAALAREIVNRYYK